MEQRSGSLTFARSDEPGPRSASQAFNFTAPVEQAVAVLTGTDFGFSQPDGDHHIGRVTTVLTIAIDEQYVRALMDMDRSRPAEIELEAQEVRFEGRVATFEIDSDTKHRLLNGLDDIASTLLQDDAIVAYERDCERADGVGAIDTTALR